MFKSSGSEARPIAALASLYIVRMLGLFMVLPVLALAGDEYGSEDIFLLGLALGIYGVTQALLQIPYGLLSDRFGRKPLILIGLLIFTFGSLVAAEAETVTGLIIGRALQGAGAIAGVVMAMVADLTSDKNRTKAMATIGASIGVAFALSLVLGPLLSSFGGIRLIFLVTAVLALLGIAILFAAVPRIPALKSGKSLSLASLKTVLINPELLRLNLGVFILHTVLTALFIAFPLLLVDSGVAGKHHSLVYLLIMVFAFAVMVPLMIIGEKRQQVKSIFLIVLLSLTAVMTVVVFLPKTQFVVIGSMLLFFIGFNYLEATLPSLMSKTVPEALRGAGSGVFSTCQFSGAAVGGICGGALMMYGGVSIVFFVAALAFACWWLFAIKMTSPSRQKETVENVVA